MDNVFIERLWRSRKYKDGDLKGYADGREAKAGIGSWIALKYPASASGVGEPDTDGGLARWRHRCTRGDGGELSGVLRRPFGAGVGPAATRAIDPIASGRGLP